MSATTDVILAAGPTVVAVAAIGAALWQQKRGFEHAREVVDVTAVRSAMDEAALALQRVGHLYPGVLLSMDERDRVGGVVDADIKPAQARLAVLLGPTHPVVAAFDACAEELGDWMSAAFFFLTLRERASEPEQIEGQERRLARAAEAFPQASARFLAAAAKTAGARLP